MKKATYIISILIFSSFTFWQCAKKLFGHIEIHGQVVNFMTHAPIQATLNLYNNDAPGNNDSFLFSTTSTSSDGSFYIRTKAGENTDYYLQVLPNFNTGDDSKQIYFSLKDNQNINLGYVLEGEYTFYCKITLVPVSNSNINFTQVGWSKGSGYNAGTSTQFLGSLSCNYQTYSEVFGKTFLIVYTTYPNGIAKDSTISIPLINTDTLQVTIQY